MVHTCGVPEPEVIDPPPQPAGRTATLASGNPERSRERKLPRSLSHSSMATYESCPKKFEFSRIDRIPDPPGRAMLIGTFAHAVLEHLMRLEADLRTMDQARRIARERWDSWFCRHQDFLRLELDEEEQRSFRKDAWQSIEGYFTIEDPASVEVVSVEKKVEARLGEVPVMGFIDRIERVGSLTVVSDYKTGKVPGANYKDEALAQPYLYAAMLGEIGVAVDGYRMLYVNAESEISGEIDQRAIESARQRAAESWGAINDDFAADNFQARPSRLCDWCGYKAICPAWQ